MDSKEAVDDDVRVPVPISLFMLAWHAGLRDTIQTMHFGGARALAEQGRW